MLNLLMKSANSSEKHILIRVRSCQKEENLKIEEMLRVSTQIKMVLLSK
jgi:hypothetical protein